MMNKAGWTRKLRKEIVEMQKIQRVLNLKTPKYPFLYPVIENAIYAMANAFAYLEGKNPFIPKFHKEYFYNRQITMHKSFMNDLHTGTEEGLRRIIDENKFQVIISRREMAESIVEKIRKKVKSVALINKELKKILTLGGNHPTFNDYLNAALNNISNLSNDYKKASRTYFDGINIIRNKVSHSDMTLSNAEKEKLIKAKLKNAISKEGGLQLTFEGYKFLVTDIIRFFDTLYANL